MTKAEVTKMVASRTLISRTVSGSLAVHSPEIEQQLATLLFPGGVVANLTVGAVLQAMGALLDRSVSEMQAADLAHTQELGDDDGARLERDEAITALRAIVIDTRSALSSTYGTQVLSLYGLAGETPVNNDLLLQWARNVATQLHTKPITEPPRHQGIQIDGVALATAIEQLTQRVATALTAVQAEERQAQLTLEQRNRTIERWNEIYQGVADTLTGLFELAARGDLAERVRPTARRRAGLTEEVDEQAPEGNAAPAGGGS